MYNIFSKLLLTILFTLGDSDLYKLTEEYIEKGGPPNLELAEQFYPYAKALIQFDRSIRFIYFIACFKWPRLIKLCQYYDLFTNLIQGLLPMEVNS